jgi:hypothetical protein
VSRPLLVVVALALGAASPAAATSLYGAIGYPIVREVAGSSEQPAGAVVGVDPASLGTPTQPDGASSSPGGTTLLADVFDPPPPNTADGGWLTGLTVAQGSLYASTFECSDPSLCFEGPSRLVRVDPQTGTSTEVGLILDGPDAVSIEDLATDPVTGQIYGISTSFGSTCFGCLYTIDATSGAASLVGVVPLGQGLPGGLAFATDGTLYLATTYPIAGIGSLSNRNPEDLLVLDPSNGQILSQEDVLLEQQFIQVGGGTPYLITSAPLGGLAVAPDGTLLATGDNGNTVVYERVMGTVKDPSGNPVGTPTWVWRVLGDSGENLTDLALVPEPGTWLLFALGLAGLAWTSSRGPGRRSSSSAA